MTSELKVSYSEESPECDRRRIKREEERVK